MTVSNTPRREGPQAYDQRADAQAQLELRISAAARLIDLAQELEFFNHGLLCTYGGLSFDPVPDLVARGGYPDPAIIRLEAPLFTGIDFPQGEPEWGRTILAFPRPADRFFQDLLAIGMVDRRKRWFHRAVKTIVACPDPLVLSRAAVLPARLPLVPLHVFGISGNRYFKVVHGPDVVGAQIPADPGLLPLPVSDLPLDPGVVAQAKRFFQTENPRSLVT